MKRIIKIKPTEKTIETWIESFYPTYDMYVFDAYPNFINKEHCIIMPKDDFFEHSVYNTLKMNNSYHFWAISDRASYVIVADQGWFDSQTLKQQNEITKNQVTLNRGLLISIDDLKETPSKYIHEDKIVLSKALFESLDHQTKKDIIIKIAQDFDEWESYIKPDHLSDHIDQIVNTFVEKEGINCFSTTLYAITNNAFIFNQWVWSNTFLGYLKQLKYQKVESVDVNEGDVVVVNYQKQPIHAAYALTKNLLLNKNGQTAYNPIKIVDLKYIQENFEGEIEIYRKKSF